MDLVRHLALFMSERQAGAGGKWYQLEKTWKQAWDAGKDVKVDIKPVYSGGGKRPEKFNVKFEIDGEEFTEPPIFNTPTGLKE